MGVSSWFKEYRRLLFTLFAASAVFFLMGEGRPFHFMFSPEAFLPLHGITESFSVIVSLLIFALAWHTFYQARNHRDLFIGVGFLAVGLLDACHALSYPGMSDFITPNTADKAVQFWTAARLTGAAVFFTAAFIRPDTDRPWLKPLSLLLDALLLSCTVLVWIVFVPDWFPTMVAPEGGATTVKAVVDFVVTSLNLVAGVLLFRTYLKERQPYLLYFVQAMALTVFSGLFFTFYATSYDIYNLMGHIYKVGAYLFIYQMLFVTSIKKPYQELFSTKEELRLYSYHLQDMVMERTQALAAKNRELERLNALKNDLMAVCSHDMKSPLFVSTILIDELMEKEGGLLGEDGIEALEMVKNNQSALMELITNILDLARREEGELKLKPSEIEVAGLLDSWSKDKALIAGKKGIGFSVEHKALPKGAQIFADEFKLLQVLNNLMSNAFKFTPTGGEVRVTAEGDTDGGVRISVFNTGPAIPKGKLEKVFDKYSQAGDLKREQGEGVGLGLAICKSIVGLHGGNIWAESKSGVGNTFRFTIPRRPQEVRNAA